MKLPTPTDPPMSTGPVMDTATLEELRRLARSRPRSGRQSVAKASAIRTLERLARERRRQPMPPMPDGWYPHEPGDPFYELDWLFLHEHPEILRRHWELAWREGPSLMVVEGRWPAGSDGRWWSA
jgi:hypothetical protein